MGEEQAGIFQANFYISSARLLFVRQPTFSQGTQHPGDLEHILKKRTCNTPITRIYLKKFVFFFFHV